jgi:hypothetical protein
MHPPTHHKEIPVMHVQIVEFELQGPVLGSVSGAAK